MGPDRAVEDGMSEASEWEHWEREVTKEKKLEADKLEGELAAGEEWGR